MSPPPLDDRVRQVFAAKQRMLVDSARLAASGHSGLDGEQRERNVHEFLEGVIPPGMRVIKGVVVNGSAQSREADAILVDARCAEIRWKGTAALVPAVCAPWIVEVKTSWRSDLLADVHTKTISAQELDSREFVPSRPAPRAEWSVMSGTMDLRRRMAVVALLGAMTGPSLHAAIKNHAEAHQMLPHLMLLAEAGLVYARFDHGRDPLLLEAGDDALLLFSHLLLDDLLDRDTIAPFVSPAHVAGGKLLRAICESATDPETPASE